MPRPKGSKRNAAVALALIDGKDAVAACKEAGFSDQTAESQAYKIIQRPEIRKLLIEYGCQISRSDVSSVARARLMEVLMKSDVDAKALVPAIRVALDAGGELGPLVNVRHQIEIPPAIQAMLAEKMAAIVQARKDNSVLGEVVNARVQGDDEGVRQG